MASGGQRFSDEHLKLMVAIGHQAALAVEDTDTTRQWFSRNDWLPLDRRLQHFSSY